VAWLQNGSMCVHYRPPSPAHWAELRQDLQELGDLSPPGGLAADMWPGRAGAFLRTIPSDDEREDGGHENGRHASLAVRATSGRWGLISAFTSPDKLAQAKKLSTVNARDDRVQSAWTYRNAWRRAQHCIVPAASIFEPDYRGPDGAPAARSYEAEIARADGRALGIAGLWDEWQDEDGNRHLSFTMLTVNADEHALMRNYHKRPDR